MNAICTTSTRILREDEMSGMAFSIENHVIFNECKTSYSCGKFNHVHAYTYISAEHARNGLTETGSKVGTQWILSMCTHHRHQFMYYLFGLYRIACLFGDAILFNCLYLYALVMPFFFLLLLSFNVCLRRISLKPDHI